MLQQHQKKENINKNPESYWSTKNVLMFYGTTKITYSGEVKIDEVGDYEIIYTVTDSHNNKTTLIVTVIVTDDENEKITIERTVYTIPSVWNMDLAEFSRCNYEDRQILGVYLSANKSIQARIISAESNINISF